MITPNLEEKSDTSKRTETNKEDFELFKKEANYWIEYFGLKQWEVTFIHESRDVNNLAACYTDSISKNCSLILAIDWSGGEISDYELRISAFHEVCELMFSGLVNLVLGIYSQAYVEERVHDIVKRMQNTIFKEYYHQEN